MTWNNNNSVCSVIDQTVWNSKIGFVLEVLI